MAPNLPFRRIHLAEFTIFCAEFTVLDAPNAYLRRIHPNSWMHTAMSGVGRSHGDSRQLYGGSATEPIMTRKYNSILRTLWVSNANCKSNSTESSVVNVNQYLLLQ